MSAYARVVPPGHATDAVCDDCRWIENFPRTEEALAAVRAHNRERHAFPEHTLDLPTTEEQAL